jgi:hypothetical protein
MASESKYDSSLPGLEFQNRGRNTLVKDGVLRSQPPPPPTTTTTLRILSQFNINFLSSGLPQMQKVRQD